MKKVYIVYTAECCEDEETCSCHGERKNIQGAFFDKGKADDMKKTLFKAWTEEIEVTE